MSRRGILRCLLAAVLFGASAPAASVLADELPGQMLAGLLYLGAAAAVLPRVLRHRPSRAALLADARPLSVAVLAGGAVAPVLFVAGLARASAATASLLLNLELATTLLFAAVVFREHLGRRLLGAAAVVTAAGILLVWAPGAGLEAGALLVVGACACWGLDNAVTARIDRLAPEHITLAKGVLAGTANLVLGLVLAGSSGLRLAPVLGALAVGAAGYGWSITLWVKGARDLGAARAQVVFAIAPFVGAVVAWVVLGDPVTATQLVAVPLAAAGVALSFGTAHQHWHEHAALRHEHEHGHDVHHDHGHPSASPDRHTHLHDHLASAHDGPHVPDLHHHHPHEGEEGALREGG